jgi:hypothetical protein
MLVASFMGFTKTSDGIVCTNFLPGPVYKRFGKVGIRSGGYGLHFSGLPNLIGVARRVAFPLCPGLGLFNVL